MATIIKGTDIIENDALSKHINEVKELKKYYDALNKSAIETVTIFDKLTKGNFGKTAKDIQQLNIAFAQTTKERKASITIDQQKIKLEEQLKVLRSDQIQKNEQLKVQISEQRKLNKALADEAVNGANAYKKLTTATNKAQAEFKRLAAQHGINSKQAQKAKVEFDKLDTELRSINNAAKDGRRDVGRYGTALQGTVANLKGLATGLGVVGGVQLLTKTIRDAFNVVKNFDQAQANLASVLGVNRDQMAALTEQAKELGATTKFTASEVSQLQLEYAKLGFTQEEIQNVTGATLELAAAAGTDLANAATITGSTLRAFGLDSTETQRVVDVMAKSFSSSSLDIEKFKVGMAAAAPVAKTFGFSIEETTALLGTLTDQGIDASTAGTGLRNMFLDANKAGMSFQEALDFINNSSDKASAAFDLFGKRGATLGVILAENQQATAGLTGTLNEAAGSAGEMADKQLDTLQGALDLLRSAWEGYILGADGAGGASEKLKNIIRFLADNLETILNTTLSVVGAFVGFKVLKSAASFVQGFGKAFRVLNLIMAANPIGLIITAVGLVVAAFTIWRKEIIEFIDKMLTFENVLKLVTAVLMPWTLLLSDATEETQKHAKALSKLEKQRIANNRQNSKALSLGRELLQQNKEEISDVSVLIDALIDENTTREEKNEIIAKLKEDYPEIIGNIDLETASTEALISVKKQLIKQILQEAIERKKAEQLAAFTEKIIDLELKKIGASQKTREILQGQIDDLTKSIPIIDQIANKVYANLDDTVSSLDLSEPFREQNDEIDKLENKLIELNRQLDIAIKNGDTERQKVIRENIAKTNDALNQALGIRSQMLDDALDKEKEVNKESADNYEKSEKGKTNTLKKEWEKRQDINKKFRKIEKLEHSDLVVDSRFGIVDPMVAAMIEANKKMAEIRQERLNELKKLRDESLKIFKEITNGRVAEIDKQIEASKEEIQSSQQEQQRLGQFQTAEAAKSIKAEKIRQAQEKKRIESLERRKKDLLLEVAGLEHLIGLIGSGTANPVQTAKNDIEGFINNLKGFHEGTGAGTVADAMGKPHLNTSKDGYIARLDGREKVLNPAQSALTGNMTADEITKAAMMYQTRGMMGTAMMGFGAKNKVESEVVKELKETREEIKKIKPIIYDFDFKEFVKTVKDGNKTERTHYNKPDFDL